MKVLIRTLIRLYPTQWYRRYGAEMEDIVDQMTPTVRDDLDPRTSIGLEAVESGGAMVRISHQDRNATHVSDVVTLAGSRATITPAR